jgi:hypothetical protein
VARSSTIRKPAQNPARGAHRNIARADGILSALAEGSAAGLRVVDVMRATGLGKASTHRALAAWWRTGSPSRTRRRVATFSA